jgi:putative FmdB family regulatory protein
MPTYEYKCDACGQAFEKFQSIKADPIKVCPHCGQESVRRLISMGGGLIFKGSGFYITDYRDKGYADSAKAESVAGGDAKPADTKGGDAKPDAKTDKGAGGDAAKPAETKPAAANTPTPTPTPTPSATTPASKSSS